MTKIKRRSQEKKISRKTLLMMTSSMRLVEDVVVETEEEDTDLDLEVVQGVKVEDIMSKIIPDLLNTIQEDHKGEMI